MSYQFEDLFEEKILPALKELLKEKPPKTLEETIGGPYQPSMAETFLLILGSELKKVDNEFIMKTVLEAILDPFHESPSKQELYKTLFDYISGYDDTQLRKIEFSENNSIVSVNYNGLNDEE